MHTDAYLLEDGTVIEGDLCIIGAGAAGISMAMEWKDTSHKVILLEGGGFEYDADIQALYNSENVGRPYHPCETSRLHFFGGTTNHWGGLCAPFDPIDFEKRDWVPHSGWPITRKQLDPYYARANKWIELGPYNYDVDYWEENYPDYKSLPFDRSKVWTKMWQLNPLRFGPRYREELVASDNVHVFTRANVTNIKADESVSEIEGLEIKCLNGKTHTVKAKHYVLACGAIQNARMLLASNDQAPKGLGNDNDLVGRYFTDHPEVPSAFLVLPEAKLINMYNLFDNWNVIKAFGALVVSDELQREHRILNMNMELRPPLESIENEPELSGNFDTFESGAHSMAFLDQMWTLVRSRQFEITEATMNIHPLFTRLEQAPNPESRIMLSDEVDALGVPKVQVQWQLTELDKYSVRKTYELVGEEAGRSGIGRVKMRDWVLEDDSYWPDYLGTGWHQMGTARMHEDPKQGVVDKHCKVHGIANLHVAGSAAFATAGSANPTLTVIALSLYLSDHLKSLYA